MRHRTVPALILLTLGVPLVACSSHSTNLDTPASALPKVSIDDQGAKWAPEPEQEFRHAQCDLTATTSPQYPSEYTLSIPGTDFYSPLETRYELTFPDAPAGMWWEQSAPIGSTGYGPAITAGHIDYAPGALTPEGGELSPWGTLHAIDECTHIFATDANGETTEYVITDKYTITQEDIATTGIFDPTHPANLILITCSGRTLEDVGAANQFNYQYNLILEATIIPTTD